MTTVLVTGGAGYIGSHACLALSRAGYTPVTYDNLSRGHREAIRWGPLEEGDLGDFDHLTAVLDHHRPAAVLHFAALAYVGESVGDPSLYYRNNVVGTLNLLEAMRRTGIDKCVFSSTCAVYGVPDRLPIDEFQERRPVNPYGRSKLAIELMLEDYAAAYGLRCVALRYFNAAGAEAESGIGECHEPEPHLIPRILDAVAGLGPIHIHGDDYDTVDGTCIRDYVHVGDLAEAHVRALGLLESRDGFVALNLGTGTGYSVREVIASAGRVTGRSVPLAIGPRRPGDPPRLVSDPGRAMQVLDWEPRHRDLDAIIESAWRWHRHGRRLAGTAPAMGKAAKTVD
jgi:UDP-glucose-4-epimerase GalE